MAERDTDSDQAHREYLLGRYHLNKRNRSGLELGAAAFRRAIDLDPSYARAWTGLADSLSLLPAWFFARPQDAYPQALEAATRALQLDDKLAEAHASMALVQHYWLWDWAGAEASYMTAIDLDPDYAAVHHWYAELLAILGRFDEAIELGKRAVQLDPLAPIEQWSLAGVYLYAGDLDESLATAEQLLGRFPEFTQARLFIGQVYKLRGRYEEAIEQFRQARTVDGDYYLVQTLALAGRTDEARALLADLIEGQPTASANTILPSHLAGYYLALGDTDSALDWLERAYDEHWFDIEHLRAYPSFKPLHSEPRFQALVEKLGLPDEPER